jgi:hypothetical protein
LDTAPVAAISGKFLAAKNLSVEEDAKPAVALPNPRSDFFFGVLLRLFAAKSLSPRRFSPCQAGAGPVFRPPLLLAAVSPTENRRDFTRRIFRTSPGLNQGGTT